MGSKNLEENQNFFSYKLSGEKTIDDHLTVLKQLASAAYGYGDHTDFLIRDKLLEEYDTIRNLLLEEVNITLDRVVELIKIEEEHKVRSTVTLMSGLSDKPLKNHGGAEDDNETRHIRVSKKRVDSIILTSLRKHVPLNVVESLLEAAFDCDLSSEDKIYCQNRYVEELVDLWLNEVSENITDMFDVNDPGQFVYKLNDATDLQGCLSLGLNKPYNNLLKDVRKELQSSSEKRFVREFKKTIIAFFQLNTSHLQDEIHFHQTLISCLKSSKDVSHLCHLINANLLIESTEIANCSYKRFLEDIIRSTSEEIRQLKATAGVILKQKSYFFVKCVRDTLKNYLNPPQLKDSYQEGRILLEIVGEHIVLSKVLPEIIKRPNFQELEEIRFVMAGVIHVNDCFCRTLWHGKNIVVSAETVIVSSDKEVFWDVSGKDAEDTKIDRAGINSDGVGLRGNDGESGEPGGNILIQCDEIKNASNLKILVNGGKGGRGQDGGNGDNGSDGHQLTVSEFKDKFPPVSKFWNRGKRENLEKVRSSIMNEIKSVEAFALDALSVGTMTPQYFGDLFERCTVSLRDMYFEIETKTGCKIVFSFYYGPIFTFCQSFLLYKGSDGEPGKDGGSGGRGGKGGFAGQVRIEVSGTSEFAIEDIVDSKNGEDGEPGESGQPGTPGTSGRDHAHIDSTKMTMPKYYVSQPRDRHRLTVKYHEEKGEDRVYCFHNSRYAEVTKVDHSFFYHQRHTKKSNIIVKEDTNLNLAHGTRKKTIDTNVILEKYNRNISTANFDKLNDFSQKIDNLYEHILEEEEEVQKETEKQFKTTRTIVFSHDNTIFKSYFEPVSITSEPVTSRDFSLDQLIKVFDDFIELDVSAWVKVKQIHLSLEQVSTLWNLFNSNNFQRNNEVYSDLRSKYQLAVMEYLHLEHVSNNDKWKCFISKSEDLVRNSLIECSDVADVDCCGLEPFLFQDSCDQRKEFIECLKSIDRNVLIETYNLFLDSNQEVDWFNSLPPSKAKLYKKQHDWSKHLKAKKIKERLLPILNCLGKAQNHQVYDEVVKAIQDENIDAMLCIFDDELLRQLLEIYKREVNGPCEWKSKLLTQDDMNSELKTRVIRDIEKNGVCSVFYRELLAQYFNRNIQVYELSDTNRMVLLSNHNPSARKKVHVLMRKNRLFYLNLDETLYKMNSVHSKKSQMYNQMQLHFASMTEKDQFDKFLTDLQNHGSGTVSKSVEISLKIKHMLMEDEYIKSILNHFELHEDKELLRTGLKMLKHENVGYQSALYYIDLHLKYEGNHLTVSQLSFVITFILKSLLQHPSKIHLVHWILAACHQNNWFTELILLKLEWYLKHVVEQPVKNNWRRFLNTTNKELLLVFLEKLDKDSSLDSKESVDEVISLLHNTRCNDTGISNLPLAEWKYLLKDAFWINSLNSVGRWSEEQLSLASYHLATLENSVGLDLCKELLDAAKKHLSNENVHTHQRKEIVLDTLKLLTSKETLLNQSLINNLREEDIIRWKEIIQSMTFSSKEPRKLEQLKCLIKESSNTSENIVKSIDEIENSIRKVSHLFSFLISKLENEISINYFVTNILKLFHGKEIPLFVTSVGKVSILDIQDNKFRELLREMKQSLDEEANQDVAEGKGICNHAVPEESQSDKFLIRNLNEIFLAIVCASIYAAFNKIKLRDTQLLAIFTFLKSSGNILGQVSTGEGKSFIIISIAIIKALSGCKVDIITSSHVLAKRDANAYSELCNLFAIEVGHNCSENIDERKKTYSNCPIVYGELAYFQRDLLLDRVYNSNVLGDRTFETVLVDEVDSLLLDKGNNVLYLSHEIPGLDKLEILFVHIWIRLNLSSGEKIHDEFVDQLRKEILHEIYDEINIEDIKSLDTSLDDKKAHHLWEYLKKNKIIDSSGRILSASELKIKLNANEDTAIAALLSHIEYLFKKIINRKKAFEIPNYLKPFVEDHLEEWIESAINAMNLNVNIDYVIDVDRSNDSPFRDPNVIIVDRDTGTDMTNSHWDQGLHQFLQLKHGCRLSPLSFKAVFISNVKYLKQYNKLYGLTGTLGPKSDRDLLKETYNVDFVTIPTAKPKAFSEEMPEICNSTFEWSLKIFEKVYEITTTRSCLIICESVNDVMSLKKKFDVYLHSKQSTREISTYSRDYEEFSNAENLGTSHIIISTNLAGRGTDIKLSEELKDAGGLHVCLSFLPNNCRIEEQAFGRAARNGEHGSGQLIFLNYGGNSASKVVDLKKKRDLDEVFRINDIKEFYRTKIEPEEKLFEEFQNTYKELIDLKDRDPHIKEVLLMSSLDMWAIWLERQSNSKRECDTIDVLVNSISQLKEDDLEKWQKQIHDPFHLTKLGLLYLKQKEYEKANSFFDQVIENEPFFCEAAYYYRACALSNQKEMDTKSLVSELKEAEKLLENRVESSLWAARIIDHLKTNNKKNVLQISSFEEQQRNIVDTYNVFIGSIRNITGWPVTPDALMGIDSKFCHVISKGYFSSMVLNDLIHNKIITQRLKENISLSDLQFFLEFGLCPKKVKDFFERNQNSNGLKLEEKILKWARENTDVPSRELLWRELIAAGVLTNEVKLIYIDEQILSEVAPSLAKKIKMLPNEFSKGIGDQNMFLYTLEELGLEEKPHNMKCIQENKLKVIIGEQMVKLLYKNELLYAGLIKLNRLAQVTKSLDTVVLNYFDSIIEEDFLKVGISKHTASCIIEDLVSKQILSEKGKNLPVYCLSTNFEVINEIVLKTYPAYLDDVKKLLSHHFAFRIALQKTVSVLQACGGVYSCLHLPLQTHFEKRIWYALQAKGIVERTIDQKEMNSIHTKYSKSGNKNKFIEIFSKVYNKDKSKVIVDELITKKWLVQCQSLRNVICHDYEVNRIRNEKDISGNFKADIQTIESIISNHLFLSENENANRIEDRLKYLKGAIHFMETGSLFLKSLKIVLDESRYPTTEVNRFVLNSFDEVVYVEEKKYTTKMKIGVLCVSLLGVIEIAVGAFLTIWLANPAAGSWFILQGVDDLVFATQCIYTGYFSLESYKKAKLMSITLASLSCCVTAWKFARASSFASETTNISVSSFKNKCCSLVSRAKTTVKTLFKPEVAKPLERKMIAQVGKRVLAHSAQAIASGTISSLVDNLVRSHVDKLGHSLINLVISDIDKTIRDHPVILTAKELCKTYDKRASQKLVQASLMKVIQNNPVKSQSFEFTELKMIKTLIERVTSREFTYSVPRISELSGTQMLQMVNFISKVCAEIESLWKSVKTVKTITSLVSRILDELNNELETNLHTTEGENLVVPCSNLEEFENYVSDLLEKKLKNHLLEHIQIKVLYPVLEYAEICVQKYAFKAISKCSEPFLKDEEVSKLSTAEKPHFKQKSGDKMKNKKNLFSSDFNRISCELIKTRKIKSTVAIQMLMYQNAPLDLYYMRLFSKLIPIALKEEGINVPSFVLVFTENGEEHIFEVGESTRPKVINISKDENLISNLKNNKLLVRDFFDFLSKCILENYPQFRELISSKLLMETFLKVLNYFDSSSNAVREECDGTRSSIIERSQLNDEYEKKTPYQHSDCIGAWKFCPNSDVDMREKDMIINLNCVQSHIEKGFNTALTKINNHIHSIQDRLRAFNLVFDDFSVTKHQLVPPPLNDRSKIFHCNAVQYELVVPLMLTGCERLVDFAIVLRLENEKPSSKPEPYTPNGPHIFYEINPVNNTKFMTHRLRGHILLNIDCISTSYSLRECRIAGELIVASNFKYQGCHETGEPIVPSVPLERVLILTDTLFKGMKSFYKLPKNDSRFAVIRDRSLKKLKKEMTRIVLSNNTFPGVKCVALFIGNDIAKTRKVTEQQLFNCIIEAIEELRKQLANATIIVYSLMYVKKPHEELFWKIFNTNEHLRTYCLEKNNILSVNTNEVIGPGDLEKDGIHLKGSGFKKLSKHLSEKCKNIVH